MTSSEIKNYINVRNGYLSSDEILNIVDTERNPQINHIIFEDNLWKMWDTQGMYFAFRKR